MAKYDMEQIEVTPRFREALEEVMRAEMEMMRRHEPGHSECWVWGKCTIEDLGGSNGLSFEYGAEEDKPSDFPACVDVWVVGL